MSEQQSKILDIFSQLTQIDQLQIISVLTGVLYESQLPVSSNIISIAEDQAHRYDSGQAKTMNRETFWKQVRDNLNSKS